MALEKPYLDVPGTTIFDADQSRKGYWLNQFCMSLMKAENRARFKANERAYLDEWKMTEAQKEAVLAARPQPLHRARRQHLFPRQDRRDRRQELPADGGQHDRHDANRNTRHDAQGRPLDRRQPPLGETATPSRAASLRLSPDKDPKMATITASVYTSHVPAIGAALDLGKTARALLEAGVRRLRILQDLARGTASPTSSSWSTTTTPPPSPGLDPDLRHRHARPEFAPADEGWGPRPVPKVIGHPELACAHRPVGDPAGFRPHHRQQDGCRPRPDRAAESACSASPRHGLVRSSRSRSMSCSIRRPSGARCFALGQAIRRAVESYRRADLKVQIWGTGGMSHQLQGPRAGLINAQWDNAFLDQLIDDPKGLSKMPHIEYVREAGTRRHRARDVADRARRDVGRRRRTQAESPPSLLPRAGFEHGRWPSHFGERRLRHRSATLHLILRSPRSGRLER